MIAVCQTSINRVGCVCRKKSCALDIFVSHQIGPFVAIVIFDVASVSNKLRSVHP